MANVGAVDLRKMPSVDEVLRTAEAGRSVDAYGRPAVVAAIRGVLAAIRTRARSANGAVRARPGPRNDDALLLDARAVAETARLRLAAEAIPSVRPVFNLTGTVLHTNLGRALIAEAAIAAADAAMRSTVTLEFDLATGRRGERDDHLRTLLCDLTGAEDATAVNNNAAAVLLVLNTFARDREAIVSRGELIEIGGAFRIPEIMARSGAKLVEVGTTNRTHLKDYVAALGSDTGLILKIHTSNYRIQGFTAEVATSALAEIARKRKVPLAHDLGSGTLVDLSRLGIAHESTVAEAVTAGADLVMFSGDKLLGGPQAGFIVGKKKLLDAINRNPLKRALRVDKIRLAALEATLRLYRDPDRLTERLPTMRLLARPLDEITASVHRLAPAMAKAVAGAYTVEATGCRSQIGSGALPTETIASAGLAIRPAAGKSGRALDALASALRGLPTPIVGHIDRNTLILDLRCLTDEGAFAEAIASLDLSAIVTDAAPDHGNGATRRRARARNAKAAP
jgi:L-seryl-tRNA(Ser) seleniumtransferase